MLYSWLEPPSLYFFYFCSLELVLLVRNRTPILVYLAVFVKIIFEKLCLYCEKIYQLLFKEIYSKYAIGCINVTGDLIIVFIDRESDITKERIQKILATGANVILTTGGIDDLCLKYFVEAGAMAVRRCKKADLKRIAKASGGEIILL